MAAVAPLSIELGIFVGGAGRRLGGVAKGNLTLKSGEKLAERLLGRVRSALPAVPVVLVGAAEPYVGLGLPALADEPAGIGPLGGLRALLAHAKRASFTHVIALSCDLPYLEAPLIARLSNEALLADCLAPRDCELWQTLVARYAVAPVLAAVDASLAADERALQRVIRRLAAGAVELPVSDAERAELRDWDEPGDAPI